MTVRHAFPSLAASFLLAGSMSAGFAANRKHSVPPKPVLQNAAPQPVVSEWKSVVPQTGLVAYWPGDGNATDVTGGFNGNPSPGVTYTAGKTGLAFQFDGSSAYVGIPFAPAFDVDPAAQFTISAWVRPETVGHYQAILVKAATRGPWEYGIIIDPTGHFYSGRDAHDVAQSKTVVVPNTWYQVAVTYNNGAIRMYVNGAQESQADGVQIGRSNAGLCIGHKGETSVPGEDPDWFQGKIDELRFYSRALSADEIKTIYDANK